MTRTVKCILAAALALVFLAGPALAQKRLSAWKLRERYTWNSPSSTLFFFGDNGEWRVLYNNDESVAVDYVGFEVELTDGTIITQDTVSEPRVERVLQEGPFGKGSHWDTHFAPADGIAITCRVTSCKDYPFLMVRLRLTNQREAPVSLARVKPFVVGPGGIPQRDGKATLTLHHINARGGRPVYDRSAPPMLAILEHTDPTLLFAVGVVPNDGARHAMRFESYEGAWMGDITGEYVPPMPIAAGETVETAPLFVTSQVTSVDRVSQYYAWVFRSLQPEHMQGRAPSTWESVNDQGTLNDLLASAKAAGQSGVRHALVPAHWERLPGSHEGRSPAFPGKPAAIAGSLRAAGMTPGITVDPLAVQDMKDAYIVRSVDGQPWVNLASAEARQQAVARLRALFQAGFRFMTVPPSLIPDQVLEVMGVSRARAEQWAFEMAAEAADGLPVFPTAADTLPADPQVWRDASAALRCMHDYAVLCAPVRFDLEATSEPPFELAEAMRGWQGPVELIGRVNNKAEIFLRGLVDRFQVAKQAEEPAAAPQVASTPLL
jgi:hypothetical protein